MQLLQLPQSIQISTFQTSDVRFQNQQYFATLTPLFKGNNIFFTICGTKPCSQKPKKHGSGVLNDQYQQDSYCINTIIYLTSTNNYNTS